MFSIETTRITLMRTASQVGNLLAGGHGRLRVVDRVLVDEADEREVRGASGASRGYAQRAAPDEFCVEAPSEPA
jgi:tetraacyldisaccharide-1-P 4'-kinase